MKLDEIDLDQSLPRKTYERRLTKLQHRLTQIQQAYLLHGHKGVIVFEGWDAAGKGGTIRRISAAMDPRTFKVWPIGPPRAYYLERHYLLRFWERLPPRGAISAFDRSWYGRVLVERVEALTPERRWRDAFREIVEFERMLADDGVRIAKLFFHISPEAQLDRLASRLHDPMKRWKLSYEDFRNRNRWEDYVAATDEMLARTSSEHAPWCLVPADDKRFGRVAALEEIVKRLGRGIDLGAPTLDEATIAAAGDHLDLPDSLLSDLRGRTE